MSSKERNSKPQKSNQMKKQIFKIAILFSAGIFGAIFSLYLFNDTNVPMALVVPYFVTSIALVGIGCNWLDKLLSNNLK